MPDGAGSTAARFAATGYVELPGLLDADEVRSLLDEVRSAEPRDPGPNELSLGGMEFASNLFYRSGRLQALVTDPRIVGPVQAILGPDVWCRWDQAVRKSPGAGWFPWHQDNGYTQLDAEHVQVWVALTRSGADNGGLRLSPGPERRLRHHRWVGHHVRMDEPESSVALEAEPGDVVVFSSFLPHATAPNETTADRWVYVAEYLPCAEADPAVPPPHLVVASSSGATGFVDLTATWSPAGR